MHCASRTYASASIPLTTPSTRIAPTINETVYDSYVKQLPSANDDKANLNICRFCVRNNRTTLSIVDTRIANLFRQVTQLDMITDAAENNMPNLICSDCEEALQVTANRIASFQEADTFWRVYFQRRAEERAHIKLESIKDKWEDCNDTDDDWQAVDSIGNADARVHRGTSIEDVQTEKSDGPMNGKKTKTLRFTCHHCNAEYDTKSQLTVHMRRHIKKANKPFFLCAICGYEFKTQNSYRRHSAKHRGDERQGVVNRPVGHLACSLCPNTYLRLVALHRHMNQKHPVDSAAKWAQLRPLMCLQCDELFPSIDAVRDHREMHNTFPCSECKSKMHCKQSLEQHMERHHSKKERSHVCRLCGEAFVMKPQLVRHTRRVHQSW